MAPIVNDSPSRKRTAKSLPKVLVVCKGNICRSPYAGAVIAAKLGSENVRSRGLKVRGSHVAAKKVRDYAAGLGVDLSQHRSKPVTVEDIEWADTILYMDASNLHSLLAIPWDESYREKLQCLGSFAGFQSVPDPNYLPAGPALANALEILRKSTAAYMESLE